MNHGIWMVSLEKETEIRCFRKNGRGWKREKLTGELLHVERGVG